MEAQAKQTLERTVEALGGRQVPLEVLRKAFVLDCLSVNAIADKFKLPEEVVNDLVFVEEWGAQRALLHKEATDAVGGNTGDAFRDYVHLFQEGLKVMNELRRLELQRYRAHVNFYGDPFVRDSKTGEIVYDQFGMPRMLRISDLPKKLEARSLQDAEALADKTPKERKKPGPKPRKLKPEDEDDEFPEFQ